jgi:hypothetical protein
LCGGAEAGRCKYMMTTSFIVGPSVPKLEVPRFRLSDLPMRDRMEA